MIVGAGQAGLARGYFLAQQGRRFTILEAAGQPAAAWRARWDSLRLFTPARYDSLPGLVFPGDPDRYPGRDDVVAYLTDYARRFELPVELNSRVHSIRRADGGFLVELAGSHDVHLSIGSPARSHRPASTSSACRGSTPEARRCWAGSGMTRSTLRGRSRRS